MYMKLCHNKYLTNKHRKPRHIFPPIYASTITSTCNILQADLQITLIHLTKSDDSSKRPDPLFSNTY